MLPLNHKRTTSSLASSIFNVANKLAIKRLTSPHRKATMAPYINDVTNSSCSTVHSLFTCKLACNSFSLCSFFSHFYFCLHFTPVSYPEIRYQFHQHFTCAFFVQKCFSLVAFWQKSTKFWWNWPQVWGGGGSVGHVHVKHSLVIKNLYIKS